LSRTTKENGATVIIPKSHLWGPDRCPLDEETVSAELEVGDAAIFVGNVYHAGGANVTKYFSPSSALHYDHGTNGYSNIPETTLARRLAYLCAKVL
jgi:ectoine hydroxylase-related dioxygenase (phytanoyl-CoA dioxygenase family)